jgi:cellulose synthase/poly-beta-1,6-N-acetylglucosamine synthase-like glycosyltransferase
MDSHSIGSFAACAATTRQHGVSVIVPALNEEVVIRATIDALLISDYAPLEVIAVDDGSNDGTATVLSQIALEDLRVRLIRLSRTMGKAHALNEGIAAAAHELIVTVDADTIVDSDFIRTISTPLREGLADAVAGNIKVGNRSHLVTALQSIEYVASQDLKRAFQSARQMITTLPGAGSAYRKRAILEAGGFSPATRAEDTELTLRLTQQNLRLVYCPKAVARTEAPTTLLALFRQRRRWNLGNMQSIGMHLGKTGRLTRSQAAGYLFLLLENFLGPPIRCALLLLVVVALSSSRFPLLLGFYGAIMAVYASAIFAIYYRTGERLQELMWLPLMLIARPLFSMAPYLAALWHYVRRRPAGWDKLDRTGEVASSGGERTRSSDEASPLASSE